jgi:hypothetical protein
MPRVPATGLLLLAMLAAVTACRKGAESQRHEAERATEKAEETAREVTLTSGTLDNDDAAREEAREAEDKALRAQGEIRKELDEIDGALSSTRDAKRREPIVRRREALAADLGALDRSTQQDWPMLKTRIDRDLSKKGP